MAEILRDEKALGEFIAVVRKMPEAEFKITRRRDGTVLKELKDSSWKVKETYNRTPDNTIIDGRAMIYKKDQPLWANSYHGVVILPARTQPVMDFYFNEVLVNPDPRFPVCGEQNREADNLIYKYESLMEGRRLSLGRLAVRETIWSTANKGMEYRAIQIGGWLQ